MRERLPTVHWKRRNYVLSSTHELLPDGLTACALRVPSGAQVGEGVPTCWRCLRARTKLSAESFGGAIRKKISHAEIERAIAAWKAGGGAILKLPGPGDGDGPRKARGMVHEDRGDGRRGGAAHG